MPKIKNNAKKATKIIIRKQVVRDEASAYQTMVNLERTGRGKFAYVRRRNQPGRRTIRIEKKQIRSRNFQKEL